MSGRDSGFGSIWRSPRRSVSVCALAWALQGGYGLITVSGTESGVPGNASLGTHLYYHPGYTRPPPGGTTRAAQVTGSGERVLWALKRTSVTLEWTHIDFQRGLSGFWP